MGGAFFIVLFLGGCGAIKGIGVSPNQPDFSGPAIPLVQLPEYSVGESFIYDDGRTETVIETTNQTVTWRDDRGIIRTKYRNFLLPDISWQNNARRSRSSTTADPGLLWPLAVGNDARFDYKQTVEDNDGSSRKDYSQSWQCQVEGTETIDAPIGTFQAFKIPCYRYTFGTSNFRQRRTFYYAPEIKSYIVRKDTYVNRPSRQRMLVSAEFNSTVLAQGEQQSLSKIAVDALNGNADGVAANWQSSDGKVTAIILPLRTYQGATGNTCREYSSTYTIKGRKLVNFRNLCKQPDDIWQREQ